MAKTYYTVLTTYGAQLFSQAMANRQQVRITHFAVGDGNGRAVQPDSTRTALVHQVHRAAVSAISPDPRNNKQVIFELTIPETVGGFWIREMGIYDANNRLVAYANCPDTYKPQLSEGSGKVQVMRMILLVSSSDAVTLTVDDSVIFATRGQLTPKTITATSQNGVDDTGHSHAINHATTSQKGIVQLTNDTGLDSEALALTAKAGKKLSQDIAQNRQKTAELANQKVNKSDVSDAVNSTSQTTVASSRAVKTAYDLAASKQSPATTLAGYGITNAMRVDADNKNINLATLLGQNTVWGTAGRERSVIGLLSNIYNYGVGLSISASGGQALIYVPHSSANDNKGVWVMSAYAGNSAAPAWRRIDGTDWEDIRNPVNASTTRRGLAQYTDNVNFDSSDWGASAKALRTVNLKAVAAQEAADNARAFAAEKTTDLNNRKLDKLVQQTVDLTNLDPNKWYPVVFRMSDIRKIHHFAIRRTLNDGNNPPWSTHASGGFTTYCEWETQPSGWVIYPDHDSMRIIKQAMFGHCDQSPVLKIGQIRQASWEYVYLRGGASYTVFRESDVLVGLGASGYSWRSGSHEEHLPIISRYDESLVPKTTRQVLQDGIDARVLDNRDNTRNLNSLLGSQCFFTDGTATGIPSGWPRDHDYNGIQADGGGQRFQILAANQNMVGLRVNDSNGDATSWSPWEEFVMSGNLSSHLKRGVSRQNYSRTVRGTNASWDNGTSQNITVTGYVEIRPDGKIEQHFYFQNFKVWWFAVEPTGGEHAGPKIPVQLWTAMPNKVTFVTAHFSRNVASGIPAGAEGTEWNHPVWAFEEQGNIKDRFSLYARRLAGGSNERIDMYIKVEGY